MKRLSLQWRITIMTALLTCAACMLTNCLVGYTGMRYMDAIGSGISALSTADEDTPQAFDPTNVALDDEVTVVVNNAQESFGATAWCITAGVTLLGGVLAYFVSGRALKPLRAFAAQVERVQPDNLSEINLSEDVPTELQRCSASFNDMIGRLDEGFSAQRQFTGNAAHELRTPLTAIRGNAEMLEDPDLPPELHEKFCSIIIAESERLSRLTHDLLTLQRIDDNAMPMELSRVNLRELATGVLDALEPILRDRHANTEIVGEAPDVLGDPDRLKQAVTNLVENASRFIEPDGHITIELFGLKGNSILAVKDDGTGFGDIDPQLLFDRFYRTDASRSRGTGGTGLGLAIVKSVVESHDGTVEAINLPDGGACFIIALPSILPGER